MGLCLFLLIGLTVISSLLSVSTPTADGVLTNQQPPDVSGIGWLNNDTFLAVHDAKFPDEADLPRSSLLTLPSQLGGTVITPLNVTWSAGEKPSSDLECIARIPDAFQKNDSVGFLIAESGDNGEGSKRIFFSEFSNDSLLIKETVEWPVNIHNVEGCAAASIQNDLIFIFAERAQGSRNTTINWVPMLMNPLRFGQVGSFDYTVPNETQADTSQFRPVSALEIDDIGNIFASSAFDPDTDVGPFASAVWLAGKLQDSSESPISILNPPKLIATVDGLKVEGLASKPATNGSSSDIIIGTDDEFSGGVLRIIPMR